MKSIFLTEEQIKQISEMQNNTLPKHLLSDIGNGDTSLSDFDFFNTGYGKKRLIALTLSAYNKAKSEFVNLPNVSDKELGDAVSKQLQKVMKRIIEKEKPIREQLEELCYNTAKEILGFSDEDFRYEGNLVDTIDSDRVFNVFPEPNNDEHYADMDEINSVSAEVQKRMLVNALAQGFAMKLSDSAQEIYLNKVFSLDEELPHLYSKLIKLNTLLLFLKKIEMTDRDTYQSGYVEVTPADENLETQTKIKVEAIAFPILLDQTLKGVFDMIGAQSLGDDMPELVEKCDALKYEPWNMMIGKELFDTIFKHVGEVDSCDLMDIFKQFSSMDSSEFGKTMSEIIADTDKSDELVNDLVLNCIHGKKYNDFEKDMNSKREEQKGLVTDDLIQENGIDEANYPEQFNMDEFKSLNTFRERIQYCEQYLMRIASGSSRIVYKIDENTVLKLAKNQKGVAQNGNERPDWYKDRIGLFAKTYDCDDDDLWVEVQLAKKAKISDFNRLTGFPFKVIKAWCQYCANKNTRYGFETDYDDYFKSDEFGNMLYDDYTIFNQLEDYISNYSITGVVDLQRISSWGIVKDNDGERLVLVDHGLSDDVFNKYYKK